MFKILVATLIIKDDKVLLVKENRQDVSGLLNLPAGKLEPNETLVQGALREIKEETGLDASLTHLLETKYFEMKETNYIAFVFQGEIKENVEILESELNFNYYDITYITDHPELLRNSELILSAINKFGKGSSEAIPRLS